MIDDATSKVVARFAPAETTAAHFDLLGRYLRKHRRPLALYSDRDSIYRAEGRTAEQRRVPTQFSRACDQLGIELILAHRPQAKGRVERFFQAATLQQANAMLEATFLPWFNRRCTVRPASPNDAHRPIPPTMDLAAILCVQHTRTVGNDYTLRFDNRIYQFADTGRAWQEAGLRHRSDAARCRTSDRQALGSHSCVALSFWRHQYP